MCVRHRWKMLRHHHPSAPQHLQDAHNSARHQGIHTLLNPPVQDLATEIQGLLHQLPQLPMTGNNTKTEFLHYQLTLSGSAHPAIRNHGALVTKERMASPLDFTRASRVLGSPPKREYLVTGQTRSPNCSPDSPSATRCMTIRTCSK